MNIQDLRAKRLSEVISNSGYSYAELEQMTGSIVSKSSIQRYATGETKKIPIDFLEKLAEVLNIDARYLMCWVTDRLYSSASFSNVMPSISRRFNSARLRCPFRPLT